MVQRRHMQSLSRGWGRSGGVGEGRSTLSYRQALPATHILLRPLLLRLCPSAPVPCLKGSNALPVCLLVPNKGTRKLCTEVYPPELWIGALKRVGGRRQGDDRDRQAEEEERTHRAACRRPAWTRCGRRSGQPCRCNWGPCEGRSSWPAPGVHMHSQPHPRLVTPTASNAPLDSPSACARAPASRPFPGHGHRQRTGLRP